MRVRMTCFLRPGMIAGLAVTAVLLIGANGPSSHAATSAPPQSSPAAAKKDPVLTLPDMTLGKKDAPINVIEYASMTCPHCAHFDMDVFPQLKKNYIDTGKVYYVFREFPLDGVAFRASMVARCMDKKHFFPFIDKLFRNQIAWANPKDWNDKNKSLEDKMTPLAKMAKQESGMTRAEFDKCVNDKSMQQQIALQAARGDQVFKVPGTPAVYIDGKLLVNFQSYESVDEELQKALKQK